eukprot:7231658-Heterocapsa_arctica.AAC.1
MATGPSGRPLAIAIRCATKRLLFFTNYEPKRSNGSQTNVNGSNKRKRITQRRKRITPKT